jgi:hypothetical protein
MVERFTHISRREHHFRKESLLKMRTNMFRSVLALGAVLAVAGPGIVLAGGDPNASYTPKILQLIGPSSVPHSTSADYTAHVTFTNGVEADYTGAPVVFSASLGSFSGNTYTAAATGPRDRLQGVLTQNGVTVTGTKIVLTP